MLLNITFRAQVCSYSFTIRCPEVVFHLVFTLIFQLYVCIIVSCFATLFLREVLLSWVRKELFEGCYITLSI